MSLFFKLAGGNVSDGDESSLEEFLAQAREYETGGNAIDTVFKVINVAFRTHPFNTVRAAELQQWIDRGDYGRILEGNYPHRGHAEEQPPLTSDFEQAAGYYEQQARQAMDKVSDMISRARSAFDEALRGSRR